MVRENSPNIFNFATSELSQDAFLCWLISWLRFPNGELHACAADLVKLFYNNYQKKIKKSKSRLSDNQKLELVEIDKSITSDDEKYVLRQKHKIDILFQVRIDGNKDKLITFVIEDKTWTTAHSDQLNEYRNKISNDEQFDNSEIIYIYFKTGYVFGSEQAIKADEYYLFNRIQIESFLNKYDHINDQIFVAYKKYFMKNYIELISVNLNILNEKNEYETFKYNYTQWDFMSKLKKKCNDFVSYRIKDYSDCVYNGTNKGEPWTQYEFVKIQYEDSPVEVMYYRLEWKKPPAGKSGYCLRLCLYSKKVPKDSHSIDLAAKRIRRDTYRKHFSSCDFGKLDFHQNISNAGDYQMEIARIHFDNNNNTVRKVLKNLPSVHSQFIAKIRKEKSLRP